MRYKWIVVGGLSLALLAMAGAIIVCVWPLVAQTARSGWRWRFGSDTWYSAEDDAEQRFAVAGPARLVVRSAGGDISVQGGAGDAVVVAAHKTAWGATQAGAAAELAGLQVSMSQEGSTVTVIFDQAAEVVAFGRSQANTVRFTIGVPQNTEVVASTRVGSVELAGTTRPADLGARFGSIRVVDLKGTLQATAESGATTIRRVQAGDGTVTLAGRFGAVEIEGVSAQTLRVEAGSGGVRLTGLDVAGSATVTSRFGGITVEDGRAGTLSVEGGSGPVNLADLHVAGAVTVDGRFGRVHLERVQAGSYDLRATSGGIAVEGAAGRVKARSDFGDIEIAAAVGVDLDLESKSGAIRFSGSLGPGPHRLQSGFGGIRLTLPGDARLTLDLKTDFGQVRSEGPVTVTGTLDRSHWTGAVGGGGPSLTATTRSGDISLETLKP